MNSLTIDSVEFTKVDAGSVFVGDSSGGWIYASQRPRHEVRCPDFYIMEEVLSLEQLSRILDVDLLEGEEHVWERARLEALISIINEKLDGNSLDIDTNISWEIRCPSQGEWLLAKELEIIRFSCGDKEILSDAVSSNYRGAMMDGRPRIFTDHGPMKWHTATMEIHPSKKEIFALSSAPMDRKNSGLSVRLVITPIREDNPVIVPNKADLASNIKDELIWTSILGVLPSFAIPWLRGMGDYIYSGWANLLFGGICVGFVTGAFWRPRRATIMYEDGEIIESKIN